ncbi:hypothetical protein D3C78_1980270 [compost metagenome]
MLLNGIEHRAKIRIIKAQLVEVDEIVAIVEAEAPAFGLVHDRGQRRADAAPEKADAHARP